jgi:hypothetical protein
MATAASIIKGSIEQEIKHAQQIDGVFLRAACLLETYYQKRPSTLLKLCPELAEQSINEPDLIELRHVLIRFIESSPNHQSVGAAINLLSMARDQGLKGFFRSKLRLHLQWGNSAVVYALLMALEDLGEKVFLTADGRPMGHRSCYDLDINLPVAKRYLESLEKHS